MSDAASGIIIVISSHVMRGSVGNRAAVFALESLGFTVWAVPTVILPWHPGHGRATRVTLETESFGAMLQELAASPWAVDVKAVLSGYLGSPGQVAAVEHFVETLKARNPAVIYACDPVIGDEGGLYVPEPVAAAIRDRLLPLATIATPNRFELSWLCGVPLASNAEILDAALALGPPRMLVTSAVAMMSGSTGNLYLSGRHALLAEHRMIDGAPNGTGDLMAALLLARLLEGHDEERTLQLATASVFEIVSRSVRRGADELTLQQDSASLSRPMALVQMRHLLHPAQKPKR